MFGERKMMSPFVNLRARSVFTLSQGASRISDMIARAKALGQPALALTDVNNLYGAMEFSKAASSAGIQPILGCEITVDVPEVGRGGVILLARNSTGYAKICGMLRHAEEMAEEKNGDIRPKLPADLLNSDGVLAICGTAPGSLFATALEKKGETGVKVIYDTLLSKFGQGYYVEICRGSEDPKTVAHQERLEEILLRLAYGSGAKIEGPDGIARNEAPLVATSDVWYASPERHDAWLLLREVSRKGSITLSSDGLLDPSLDRFHLRGNEEMATLFADLPEAVRNTREIAQRCSFMVKGRAPILPAFPTQGGQSEAAELRGMASRGLSERLQCAPVPPEELPTYEARLEFELSVIEKMGFPGYFLIVADFIQWAKKQGIPVGPGRGSGAGSLVAWALTITDLDPIKHGLLFERFLNPERVSMPDFDIDFCQDRREEVIAYVRERYGADRVAAIATFGEIKSKTAIKDAHRVLIPEGFSKASFAEVNDLTGIILPNPETPAEPMGLKQAYEEGTEFREAIENSPKLRAIYEQAVKIEGLVRTVGMHAAGVVIADRPIDELVPVGFDRATSMPVVGFNLKGAEASGLVKFDFLGLKTLSIIARALENIKRTTGEVVDVAQIPLDDPEVMERYRQAQTAGIFQFESQGMRNVLKQVKPTRFADLIAINALFRPGPMAYIQTYAARKNGDAEALYPSPAEKTKPFLEETYGIMVYQEQVMQVAQACAGYSLGGADLLRRAMGKKIPSEMAAHRKIFVHGDPKASPPIPGAVKLGMPETTAERLFDDIAAFAGYGFNKSHSAAYSWISYQTAWLKTYYPSEFFAALMSYNTDNEEKLAGMKAEMETLGGVLLPPDINLSNGQFSPEDPKDAKHSFAVRYGFSGIKTISGATHALEELRAKGGSFTSLEEFSVRTNRLFNKGQIEKLCEAGAFDAISKNRRQAFSLLSWLADRKDKAPKGQADMFGGVTAVSPPENILNCLEWGDVVQREFSAFGFYIREHPIERYLDRLIAAGVRRRQSFVNWMRTNGHESLKSRRLCVMVDEMKRRETKKTGAPFIEAFVSEKEDSYRVAFYEPRQARLGRGGPSLAEMQQVLDQAKATRTPVVLVASLSLQGEQAWINGEQVMPVEKYLENLHGALTLFMTPERIVLDPETELAIARKRREGLSQEASSLLESKRVEMAQSLARRMAEKIAEACSSMQDGDETDYQINLPNGVVLHRGRLRQNAYVHAVIRQFGLAGLTEKFSDAKPEQANRHMAA